MEGSHRVILPFVLYSIIHYGSSLTRELTGFVERFNGYICSTRVGNFVAQAIFHFCLAF